MKIGIAFLFAVVLMAMTGCASMQAIAPDQTAKSVQKTKDTICKHYCGRLSEEVRLEFRAAYGGAIVVNCPLLCGASGED